MSSRRSEISITPSAAVWSAIALQCDAYEVQDRRIAIIGAGICRVQEEMLLRTYTGNLTVLSLGRELETSQDERADLHAPGIRLIDHHQRTSVPGLYAVGDVVAGLTQIGVAMGKAAIAASAISSGLERRLRRSVAGADTARSRLTSERAAVLVRASAGPPRAGAVARPARPSPDQSSVRKVALRMPTARRIRKDYDATGWPCQRASTDRAS
jgi:hypothetical protein